MKSISEIMNLQSAAIAKKQIIPVAERLEYLKRFKEVIREKEESVLNALYADLHKSKHEAFMVELGSVYGCIGETLRHLKDWAKPKKVPTPFYQWGNSYILQEPYGQVVIIAPFNYPFQLAIEPLVGAIAAGNRVVLKPSELTPHTAEVIEEIIKEVFPEEYVAVVQGGVEETTELLTKRFDYIFFTGSVPVGKVVMKAAAEHLTPVTLELGGKSPVIVDQSADLARAAKRIIWGKLLNSGQTCIAPDYILVHAAVKSDLIRHLEMEIRSQYGEDPKQSPDFGRMINAKHVERLSKVLEKDRAYIICGGQVDPDDNYIAPTIIDLPHNHAACMQEELFGPILPVISVKSIKEAVSIVKQNEKPLACYPFAKDPKVLQYLLKEISAGNMSINDTMKHASNRHLPFGGVGHSGIGRYHGKYSFETFSHEKGIYENSAKMDLGALFAPYTERKWKPLRKLLK